MSDHGRDERRVVATTLWLALGLCCVVWLFASSPVGAEPRSAFDRLAELDRKARHHRVVSDRIDRAIRRWERVFASAFEDGEIVEQARLRLQRRAMRRLIGWERLHRRITRGSILWKAGAAADLRRLLRHPEIESLEAKSEWYRSIGELDARAAKPGVLLRRRAGLAVELAQHRASGETAEAEKEEVVESAKEGEEGELEEDLEASQNKLEQSLEKMIEHETGRDFHKRKGALMPPVPGEPAHGYGKVKQDDSVTYVRHTGLTWEVEEGTPVRATGSGLVVFAERMKGYGDLVIVDHGDDYHSLYAHLSEISVEVGEELARGQRVGSSGASDSLNGPKLYFELRHDAKPIDPQPWFVRRK